MIKYHQNGGLRRFATLRTGGLRDDVKQTP